jgi:DNA repair exonuclease SbcCD ATPase subunit
MIEYREKLNQAIGKKDMLTKTINAKSILLKQLDKTAINIEKSQVIAQNVAKNTQENLRYHIEDIVQLALDAVFPDQYIFSVEFVIKRGKTEACISFSKDGSKVDPMIGSGGGVVDVAAFALRLAAWSLSTTDNVMILDEPGKWISKDLIPKFAVIVKNLSKRLGLQFLIVTHIKELTENADKVFEVSLLKNGRSKIGVNDEIK